MLVCGPHFEERGSSATHGSHRLPHHSLCRSSQLPPSYPAVGQGLNYYLHFDDAQSGVCERVEASLLDFFLDLLWLKIWVGSEKRIDKLEQEEI